MSIHETKDGRWYCRFWEDGRYHKKYFGRGKKANLAAKKYDLNVKTMKVNGVKVICTNEPQEKERLYFGQLAQLYLDDRRNSGWPEKSVYNFRCFMNRYVIPFMGHKRCEEISMTDLVNLRFSISKDARKRDISPHSINRYITMTKAVFSWGVNNDFIAVNPWSKYKKPREIPNPPDLLTIDEFVRVMNCATPHCRWALDVEFNTGCRPGKTELFALKYSDVDWAQGRLLIRSTKTRPRVVDLRADFLERLRSQFEHAQSDYIVDYKGQPISKLRRSWKTALTKAGIRKKVRLYDIRHMYGTFMAQNGADVFAIQSLMGHTSITTTRRYLHHAEHLKKEAVNRLPVLHMQSAGTAENVVALVPKLVPKKGRTAAAIA